MPFFINSVRQFIILIVIIQWGIVNCQINNLKFNHLTSKDGLPHSLTFSITQDKQGFIWFGTNNGLARYDGINFKIFQPSPNNSNSLGYKGVSRIVEDNDNNLWLYLNSYGLDKFDVRKNKFYHFTSNTNDEKSVSSLNNLNIYIDKIGQVWIYTANGLNKYNSRNNTFQKFFYNAENQNSIPSNGINSIVEDYTNNLWIATDNGVAILDNKTNSIYRLASIYPNAKDLENIKVNKLLQDKEGYIWICTDTRGLVMINPRTSEIKQINTKLLNNESTNNFLNVVENNYGDLLFISHKNNYTISILPHTLKRQFIFSNYIINSNDNGSNIYNILPDTKGNFWLCFSFGLYQFNISNFKLNSYSNNICNQHSIAGNNLSTIFIDRTGVLWIGVYKVGIDMVDLNQKKFNSWVYDKGKTKTSLQSNNILNIFEDSRKNIWVGSVDNGVSVYNSKKELIKHYDIDITNNKKLHYSHTGAICQDSENNIWLGYWQGLVEHINLKTNTITHFALTNIMQSLTNVRKIVSDNQKNLWFVCGDDIIKYNYHTKKFESLFNEFNHNAINEGFNRTIYFDRNNNIWVGSQSGGLLFFDIKTKKYKRFTHDNTNTTSISNNTVYSIFEDEKGFIWVGTAFGINKFDPIKNIFESYNNSNGLCNNTVYSIIPDNNGFYWLATDNGLSQFNPRNLTFNNYFESDGLISNEFNSNASTKFADGTIYLGTPKGIVYFNPSLITKNVYNATPRFTNFRIFNNIINPGDTVDNIIAFDSDISFNPHVTLKHNSSLFSIDFSSNQFNNIENTKFEYKLEGFDNNWTSTNYKNCRATYTNIPDGNYTFILKATNNDNKWNKEDYNAQINITIIPPYYKTWWFRIIVAIIIIIIIYAYFLNKINFYKKNQIKLKELVTERTKELEETNTLLEEQQEEINLQKEELHAQKETLQEINKVLKEEQEKYIIQNEELEKHRNHLEDIVIERTREMQLAINRAEESDRLKSDFLANMSHEIRTPMNAIVGFSNLISDQTYDLPQRNEFIKLIRKNSETLLLLIDDILDLSKIQSKQLIINPREISLNNIFSDLNDIYVMSLKKENLEIRHKLLANYTIEADPIRLKQILTHLISNAVKFTDSGFVEFGAIKDDTNFIRFYVTDTGIGIPGNVGNTIFDRFHKLAMNKEKFLSGVGLGLSISKSLTELMGGKIWYKSEYGKGSTFYFTLPVKQQTTNTLNELNPVSTKVPNLKTKIIVIAEDEEANFKVLSAFLAKTGASVLWAKNGKECIEMIRKNKTDLVLMDIKMPEMDGLMATQIIKNEFPNLPIIAQTAFAREQEKEEYFKAGFDGYMVKPIKISHFYSILKNFLLKQ